ncbi:ABC transporter substrate-binding protein [Mangrovihabitans endophyticus]|uniref:ABC transporter substrate-binding protein n=1 Tax=Mangrovihabitans endophyticus TaxID=1751298 RepID=A0A8J3FMP3_9ACTN|nr:sugar ABC transporter substrate-binding protein [Mangrovihabitans endophyticus]GGK77693.1 ABC transporter substrate-binding protein [Mangrovihabitans endophyticus]
MRRRELLQITGLAGAAAALDACGSAVLPEPDFAAPPARTVTMWCRAATVAGVQVVVDRFHQAQNRLRIDLTPVPDGQYVTKLATAIRGRRVPDIVDIDDINSMLFIYRDAFADLTDHVRALPYRDVLSPGHLRLATRDGRHYGLPYLADNSLLWYDTALLDRAGVDPATATTSLDGLLDAAGKVRRLGDDVFGWSIAANSAGILGFVVQPHIWATGRDQIAGEIGAQHGDIAGNPALRATLSFYRSLWREGLMSPGTIADAGTTWGSDFRAGTVGFFPSNYSAVVSAADAATRARTGVTMLCGPDGGAAFFDGGDNLCIPRGATNAAGAWQFARFALDVPQQQLLPEGGYTPVRADVNTPEFTAKYPLGTVPLDHLDRGYAPVTLAYNLLFNQADSPWIAMFRRAVFDGDLDGALEEGQTAFDRILRQAQL